MSPRTLVVVQRLALLAAILASAALIIDYQNIGDPTFCGTESACFKVRASDVGRDLAGLVAWFGSGSRRVTVPHIGVLAHVVLLALALAASTRAWMRVVAGVATVGALGAVYLLIVQWRMGELCSWCAVVDTSSILCAISSVLLVRAAGKDREPGWGREGQTATSVVVWSAAAAMMVGLPHIWASYSGAAALPPVIEALQVPGKVTVVSFTDFECPFCRKLAPTLTPLHDDPAVVVKRFMAPLDMHPGAKPAAIAYLCAPDDKKDAFATLLYEAPDGSFSTGNLAWMAERMGLDKAAFAACQKDPSTSAKVDEQTALFKEAGGSGLPTTFVGKRVVKGFQPDKVTAALQAERAGSRLTLPVWMMFVAAAAVGAWTTAMHLRAARALPPVAQRDEDGGDVAAATAPLRGATAKLPKAEEAPKKPRRKPATTSAATPAAKRAQGADVASDDESGAPAAEKTARDVVVSEAPEEAREGAPDSGNGTGEKT